MTRFAPRNFRLKLIIFALCAAIIAVWVAFDLPCLIRSVTGFECLTCGMSRAWVSAFRLDFSKAFSYHPMFWSVPVFVFFLFYDCEPFKSKALNYTILFGLVFGLVVCYAVKFL